MEYVVQVEMKAGSQVRVGWVDENLAKLGKKVQDDDEVGPVWTITQVYNRMPKSAIDMQDKAQRDFAKKLGVKNCRD